MNSLWLPLLLSSVIWAEEQYFLQSPNATWDEARLYCQSCFKELTTITSRNVHLIVQNLSSDYWVGLRKSYNGSFSWAKWSKWSNGDPVTYQNWYPGHPVPNKEKKLIPVCSSTTQSPLSTHLSTTTPTSTTVIPTSTTVIPPQTTTVTAAPMTSTIFKNSTSVKTCPLLADMLFCLNITCYELESAMSDCNKIPTTTPKTTSYTTTTFNPATNGTTTGRATTGSNTTRSNKTGSTTTGESRNREHHNWERRN
ncbi:integumentary mucin C.1-like [Labeo rohita]|uniref:integumentary mucin C.1-like n=1 Tax=Labeo rohita TaxID=84645 RepID=UPI0021E24045|nr:integumentary mucin C.1-like [Labeo rohita]